MLSLFKKLIPVKIKAYIKMGDGREFYEAILSDMEKKRQGYDVILGTPIHTNLGDHLITIAELKMFHDINPQRKVYEIPTEVFQYYKKRIKKIISSDARIFINGGGWMGNLWPNEEKVLQDMVASFRNHKIVIFPQTIYYDKNKLSYYTLLDRGNEIYRRCKDITLFTRDSDSYTFALKEIDIPNIKLVPDVALYLPVDKTTGNASKKIGICLRNDRERSADKKIINNYINKFIELGYVVDTISTMDKERIPLYNRTYHVGNCFKTFKDCDFVITDRLHGMIYSYLTNTPCIIFDNKTKKVSGVYKVWLKNCPSILPGYYGFKDFKLPEFIKKNENCNNNMDFSELFVSLEKEVKYG